MNLSLALGFHFDSSPAQLLEHEPRLQPVAEPVIDVLPEPAIRHQTDLVSGHKLLLTYNFRGLPEPVWADISTLNLYV